MVNFTKMLFPSLIFSQFLVFAFCLTVNTEDSSFDTPVSISGKTASLTRHFQQIVVSTPTIPNRAELAENPETNNYYVNRGIYKFIFPEMEKFLNLTVKVLPSTGGGTGLLVNGTWNGVIGDLLYNRADVGIVTAVTLSRFSLVEFSSVFEFQDMAFVIRRPSRIYSWKSILWPLKPFTWFILSGFLALFYVLLALFPEDSLVQSTLPHRIVGPGNSFLTITAILFEETAHVPRSYHSRILCLLWLMLILNVSCVYKSRYFSSLTFPRRESIPQTFQELAESKYELGLNFFGGAAYYFIKTSQNPTFLSITKRLQLVKGSTTCYDNVYLKSRHACINWRGSAEYILKTNKLKPSRAADALLISSDSAFVTPLAFSFPKHSILLPYMNKFVGGCGSGGLVSRWISMDYEDARRESNKQLEEEHRRREGRRKEVPFIVADTSGGKDNHDSHETKASSLKLEQCSGPFLMLALGTLGSGVAFVAERAISIHKSRNKNEKVLPFLHSPWN